MKLLDVAASRRVRPATSEKQPSGSQGPDVAVGVGTRDVVDKVDGVGGMPGVDVNLPEVEVDGISGGMPGVDIMLSEDEVDGVSGGMPGVDIILPDDEEEGGAEEEEVVDGVPAVPARDELDGLSELEDTVVLGLGLIDIEVSPGTLLLLDTVAELTTLLSGPPPSPDA